MTSTRIGGASVGGDGANDEGAGIEQRGEGGLLIRIGPAYEHAKRCLVKVDSARGATRKRRCLDGTPVFERAI